MRAGCTLRHMFELVCGRHSHSGRPYDAAAELSPLQRRETPVSRAHQQSAERLGHLDVAIVAGWQFVGAPAVLFRFGGKGIEDHASRIFVGDSSDSMRSKTS